MNTVIAVSADKKWIRIGADISNSAWYQYACEGNEKGRKIASFTHKLSGNTKIIETLDFEVDSSVNNSNSAEVAKEPEPVTPAKEAGSKAASEALDNAMKKASDASIMGTIYDDKLFSNDSANKLATAITLFAMQGMIDPQNVSELIGKVYKSYKSL